MMWLLTALSIVGVVLNIQKNRSCFKIWVFTNASWCVYDFLIKAYAQSFLFLVYTALAVWGFVKWKK
ncbi:MAG: nicotinamide mononucleotide transporter [Candidatus Omnitrophota bacterium]